MRKKLVAGNWKMNGSRQQVQVLLQALVASQGSRSGKVDIVVCPPAVYLQQAQQLLQDVDIELGAQNAWIQPSGAFTGEHSVAMLAEFSVKYILVGHSERRQYFNENDKDVAAKFAAIQENKLTPILCLGESLEERDSGVTKSVVATQLRAVIQHVGIEAIRESVIAYEPIWAIGTGRTASPDQAQEVHEFVRGLIAEQDNDIADRVRIIYGGSVKADNAKDLFSRPDIDGGLVGGASLNAEEFIIICDSVS